MSYISQFIKEFAIFFNDVSIYLIIGFLIAAIMHIFFSDSVIKRHIGKDNFWSVFKASMLGIPIPICSCGVIPVATSLRKKGASKGATLSFLISTPQIGADSFMMTYSMIGWIFAIFRIIAAFITSFIAGIAVNIFDKNSPRNDQNNVNEIQNDTIKNRAKNIFSYTIEELFGSIAKYLFIGIVIAAAINTFVPDDFFKIYLSSNLGSMLLMLLIGIPLYVCAVSSTPIAASMILKGLSPGAGLVFLLAGPATNAATITTIAKVMGKKVVAIYLISISAVSIALGYILNMFVGTSSIKFIQSNSNMFPNSVKLIGSMILVAMYLIFFIINLKPKKKLKHIKGKKIYVGGMTCNHCKANVEKAALSIDGINEAVVNLSDKSITISGKDNANIENVKKAISDSGYEILK